MQKIRLQIPNCFFHYGLLKPQCTQGVYITMTSFAHILKEAEKVAKMSADFSIEYLGQIEAQQQTGTATKPATESLQGEQKAPVVKPNGVTR